MKAIKQHKAVITLGVAYAVYVVMAYLTRYTFFQQNFLQVFYILFPFVLGAMMAKYNAVEWFKEKCRNGWLPWLLLIVLVVVRYFVKTGAVLAFYSGAIVILVAVAYKPMWLCEMLHELGRVNVWMWMIHGWLIWYIWHDAFYSLHYPLLIFLAAVAASYVLALIFDFATKPLMKKIFW